MNSVKKENARDFKDMFPVILTTFDIASPEGEQHEVLSKFKPNKVYKAYKNEEGYFLFPVRNESTAFLFPKLKEDNKHYKSEIVILTVDNFHEYINEFDDEDIEYFNELLEKPIEKEIDDRAVEELEAELDVRFEDKVIARSNEVVTEEYTSLFKKLNELDPKMSRALYEFGKYVAIVTQTQQGIDQAMMDVLNDRNMGKGAYIAKAMENILRYSKSQEREAFNHVLKTAMYSLIEMKRNL